MAGSLQQPQGAGDVNRSVVDRVFGRLGNAHLGSQVEYNVRLFPMKNVVHQLVGNVAVMKGGGRIEVSQLAGAQVIHHHDLMAFRQQPVDQMGPNKSGSASNYYLFGLSHAHLGI